MNGEINYSEEQNESSVLDARNLAFKQQIRQNVSSLIELLDIMSEEELFNHYGEMTFLKQALTAIETLDCPEKRQMKLNHIEKRIVTLKDSLSSNLELQTEETTKNRK